MEIYCENTLRGLVPMYDSDLEEKKRLQIGQVYKVKISRPRNYKFHKKYFALVKLAFDNQEVMNNMDHFRKELIKEAGFYEVYQTLDGVQVAVAKSISFGSMNEDEFSDLYNRTLDVLVKYFHWNKEEIAEEIERYY